MDIEWGKDGVDGELYILQARPETVKSRAAGDDAAALPAERARRTVVVEGRAIGQKIGAGAGAGAHVDVDADGRVRSPATCWSPT